MSNQSTGFFVVFGSVISLVSYEDRTFTFVTLSNDHIFSLSSCGSFITGNASDPKIIQRIEHDLRRKPVVR